MIIIVFLLFIW